MVPGLPAPCEFFSRPGFLPRFVKRRGKRPENAGERPNSDEIKPAGSRARKRALVFRRFGTHRKEKQNGGIRRE